MTANRQTGAVLVIGLMLLSVLTLLATSTLGTAAISLALAGNEQYQARALEAAQAGIEHALALLAAGAVAPGTLTGSPGGDPGDHDSYEVVIRPRGITVPPPAYLATFLAEHHQIESTGKSLRGARSTLVQGLFIVRPPAAAGEDTTGTPPPCLAGVELRPNLCAPIGAAVRTYWRPAATPGA